MKKTQEGKIIEQWATKRGGLPAKVKGTKDLIRIRFDDLEEEFIPITWFEFFKDFEKNKLTFIYEEDDESRFCKFIDSDSEE